MVTVPAGRTSSTSLPPEANPPPAEDGRALRIQRYFTKPGVHPFDEVAWERRNATIADESGQTVFEQRDVEVPASWSQTATNVVVSKYFRGPLGTPQRETSVRQLIRRVVGTLTQWGREGGYFLSEEEAQTFHDELTHLLLHQTACFNSPVWFNVGVEEKPQCSACFILSVGDTMESILEWCKTEGMIFKGGSGSGINLSSIRSSREQLSSGGQASGPVSFMRGADAIAGSIKSGGKTRRAAKMVVLNADHPDVLEFIECKAREERKAYDLGSSGWDMSLNGEAWASIQFQNANNSVRATDEFMSAASGEDRDWELRAITTGEVLEMVKAREVLRRIAQATWECGDPGMQFDTTINRWHTCPASGRINASNPCSEYMHVDDSACNLASLNLMRFLDEEGCFDIEAFRHAAATVIWAQEIIVGYSSYPTQKIERNAREMRQLGLGYANLGALLMALGVPYDSDVGRAYAAAITALMTGHAYATSAVIAERVGPFAAYEPNREPMLGVIGQHRDAAYRVPLLGVDPGASNLEELVGAACEAWDRALELGRQHGYRNAQATVIAPTGTIAFMMDCDTTGIEPDIALVKYKKLVGGGLMKMVNQTVPPALRRLGYDEAEVAQIVRHVDEQGTIEGAPGLRQEHLPVFDCAFKAEKGRRCIHPMGHIKMMGACQPFVSGAISKTVNLPKEATVEEIMDAYIEAWRHGLKAIAIYRDGSKKVQPLSTGTAETNGSARGGDGQPRRRALPDTRSSITHKFKIEGHTGYITVGVYEDGSPAEVFISMAKQGSTIYGMMESFGRAISYALQYGVPLRDLVRNFSHMRFEPSGMTSNPEIPFAQSVIDYLFRWLASQFLSPEEVEELGVLTPEVKQRLTDRLDGVAGGSNGHNGYNGGAGEMVNSGVARLNGQSDAPACAGCGWIMVRSGTCYRCENCGSTSGCS
ncbi:MAG: ribonucleoside-diphosphate reductase, adenosylcobalamin-dependent [Chloroflexi bacterium RBG_16_68_14]|nr:MAG: ribonucleoside-diphosphate reductase, adenosylcobalamin-dependent [Chloroflexi bacterium RBG_16_68_14]